ncbi:MAG: aminoacyl-tRNA hydrolase [Desulfobulbus oligotrophicus]|jgi:PTH1 family peptidyl-tRNA hydrolase|nr:aminoacyl-tRNA hydrolase [Desulfobulbus oligotrophicus]
MSENRFLLVGLGNPGSKYHLTRHNVGFFFVDYLADSYGWKIDTLKMKGCYCQGRLWGAQVFLLKPQTYMNRSGESVRSFLDYFKISSDHLLVLHDDIDLQSGRIKVVSKGGAGGHNGVRSVIQHLGTQNINRLRIGIGRPACDSSGKQQSVEQFVLSPLNQVELALFEQQCPVVAEAAGLFVRKGIQEAMNQINGLVV